MEKDKILYYGAYPLVAGGLAAGCVVLSGLAMIIQHNSGRLAEKLTKFYSNEPEKFSEVIRKSSQNPLLLYKEIFTDLLNSYRESFRGELISS